MRKIALGLAAALVVASASKIEARPQRANLTFDNDGHVRSSMASPQTVRHGERAGRAHRVARHRHYARGVSLAGVVPELIIGRGQIVGSRPAGCPHQYCGCGTSLKIFGRIRPELNLASNWLRKFPRTAPAPGMVAARSGHVMTLMEHVGGDKWKVWDANSGGGLTRIHIRSIRGFGVVNPHATAIAGLAS